MRIAKLLLSFVAVAALAGCAHPIMMTPNVEKIAAAPTDQKINKNVAYYIDAESRVLEVTTPGGGGDKVSYLPYRDIETGFYKMLTNVFPKVTTLTKAKDAEAISKNDVKFVITPTLATSSSSPSPLTWPPTKFSVILTCYIADAAGNHLVTKKVTGEGAAEWDEFKSDFSLSAKRASEDALLKMQRALLDASELKK